MAVQGIGLRPMSLTTTALPNSISKSSVHFAGFASRISVLPSLRLRVYE